MFKSKQHSNYWLGGVRDSKFNLASKGATRHDVMQLASIKRAVTNFVKITTGRQIPVQFSSGTQSYTDGDTVVISADTDEKSLDAVVGLALHEATHCVWREFPDFLRTKFGTCRHVIAPQILIDKVDKLNSTKDADAPEFQIAELPLLIKTLMNVFEDRRIDWWLYREAPGYRPYYEALYNQYWHSEDIDSALQQGKWDIPTVGNYVNQLINMTNPWFDSRSLPGMSEIYKVIDVDNINRFDGDKGWKYAQRALPNGGIKVGPGKAPLTYDLDKMPQIFQLAVEVLGLIIDNAIIANQLSEDSNCDSDEGSPSPSGDSGGSDDDMEDNLDTPQMSAGGGGESEEEDSDDEDSDDEDSNSGSGSQSDDEEDDEEEDSDSGSGSGSDEDSDDEDDEEEDSDTEKGDGDDSEEEDSEEEDSEGDDEDGDDSSEKKAEPKPKKMKKINEKALEDALEKQRQFLDGDVEKEQIDDTTDNQVSAIEQSGAEQIDVEHGSTSTKVLVMNKLDKSILCSGAFPFVEGVQYSSVGPGWHPPVCPNSKQAVEDGFRMGRVLASRLSIRNQNQVTTFNRRRSGKIDKRRLSNLGHGDDSVFYKLRMTEYQPVLGHMSIDASSSMNGTPWRKALASAIAVAVAADTIENLDFVISIRSGTNSNFSSGATIAIIYDSRVDNPSKIRKLFPYITSVGGTPEGLCFAAILDTLIKEQHGDRYFINLSDGQPYFTNYSGDHAHRHTRDQVNLMRGAGMNILSYFVGDADPDDIRAFKLMYGVDASFIDVSKISSLVSTLNKLFLVR